MLVMVSGAQHVGEYGGAGAVAGGRMPAPVRHKWVVEFVGLTNERVIQIAESC